MAHQEYEDLLTLQALDALDASDERRLAEHLETCSSCRGESTELRDAAGLLAHAAPLAEPGAEVRARILETIRQEGKPARTASAVLPFQARPVPSPWASVLRLAA